MDELIKLLSRQVNYAGELKMTKEMTDVLFRWLNALKEINTSNEEMLKTYSECFKDMRGRLSEGLKSEIPKQTTDIC